MARKLLCVVNKMGSPSVFAPPNQGGHYAEHQAGRAKVAGGQDHEVKYEAGKRRLESDVKDAVKSEGNSRRADEKKLGSK